MNIEAIKALPVCGVPLNATIAVRLQLALQPLREFLGAPGDWGYNTQLGLLAQLVHHVGTEHRGLGVHPAAADEGLMLGLTEEEEAIGIQLGEVWNRWLRLPDQGPGDRREFQDALNDAHKMLALRVARRMNPGFWRPQA